MDITLNLQAGARGRDLCPVAVELAAASIAALTDDAGRAVPCQSRPTAAGRCELRFIVDNLPAGATRTYRATVGAQAAAGPTWRDEGGAIKLLDGEHLLTAYHYLDPKAARPYWFPLLDPYGHRVTRSFPMERLPGEKWDHPHHRSLWVAYGEVNGTDNWSEDPKHATQAHQGFNYLGGGPVALVVDHNVSWRSHEGTAVLDERRVWRYYHLGERARLIDLEVDLTPAAGVPEVVFGDTKEGGLCSLRVATSMDVPKGKITNSRGGVDEKQTWGKRAEWCDYSGPVEGQTVGLTILDHPSSFRHPTWWHVRDYGLMTANCFGLSHFTNGAEDGTHHLPAGQTLKFRFRVYVHRGDCAAATPEARWQDYAQPTAVTIG
jgi:hypothetical protein